MGTSFFSLFSPSYTIPLTRWSKGSHSENCCTYSHTRSNLVWNR